MFNVVFPMTTTTEHLPITSDDWKSVIVSLVTPFKIFSFTAFRLTLRCISEKFIKFSVRYAHCSAVQLFLSRVANPLRTFFSWGTSVKHALASFWMNLVGIAIYFFSFFCVRFSKERISTPDEPVSIRLVSATQGAESFFRKLALVDLKIFLTNWTLNSCFHGRIIA